MFFAQRKLGEIKSPIRIVGTGCWHLENRAFLGGKTLFHVRGFRMLMDLLSEPNTYALQVGDMFSDYRRKERQARMVNYDVDKWGSLSDEDEEDIDRWKRRLDSTLGKVAHKFLGGILGNHYRLYADGSTNVQRIFQHFGIPFLGPHRGYLDLTVTKPKGQMSRVIRTFITHGSGGAGSNDTGKLKAQTSTERANAIFAAHTHRLGHEIAAERCIIGGKTYNSPVPIIRCGSLRVSGQVGFHEYEDFADMGALPCGFEMLEMRPLYDDNGTLRVLPSVTSVSADAW